MGVAVLKEGRNIYQPLKKAIHSKGKMLIVTKWNYNSQCDRQKNEILQNGHFALFLFYGHFVVFGLL